MSIIILLLLSSFSWADEEKDDPKVDEYKIALEAFFNSDYLLCLGEGKWPVYSNEDDAPWVLSSAQLKEESKSNIRLSEILFIFSFTNGNLYSYLYYVIMKCVRNVIII